MERVKLKRKKKKAQAPSERKRHLLTININEDWRLINDGRQFIIEQRKKREDDVTYWKVHGYLTTLGMAVRWLAQKQIYLSKGVFDGRALLKMEEALGRIERDAARAVDAMCKAILADNVFTQEFAKRNVPHLMIPVLNTKERGYCPYCGVKPGLPHSTMCGLSTIIAPVEEPRVLRRKKIVVPDEYRETNKHGIPKFLVRTPERVRIVRKEHPRKPGLQGRGEGQSRSPSPNTGKHRKPPHNSQNASRKGTK